MERPSVFIGSSGEGSEVARRIREQLKHDAEITIWYEGVFGLNRGNLENLVNALDDFDFAILVLTPDDMIESRNQATQSPRDNVLFECGLFMGRLGRYRTFIVYDADKEIKIPSDLAGITLAAYKGKRRDDNLLAAVGEACDPIRDVIRKLGSVKSSCSPFWEPFVEGPCKIVLGRFLEFREFEQSGFLGAGCAISFAELSLFLASQWMQKPLFSYADRIDGDALKTNIISIGGPDANLITKEIIARANTPLRFGNPDFYEILTY